MLGNVVVGMTILGPAGMLTELATGLGVGIHDTGLLVTYGAVVLCIGSPLMAWLTTRIDRRVLLVVTLAVLAIGQGASAPSCSGSSCWQSGRCTRRRRRRPSP
jgi:MFS transporter, DHA1 family, inner membrane transport protein